MHATVGRNEPSSANGIDGLRRETGQAVGRDLLEFEVRRHDRWMRQQGSWSPG